MGRSYGALLGTFSFRRIKIQRYNMVGCYATCFAQGLWFPVKAALLR